MSCGIGCRHSSGLALLWLWCTLAATASDSTPSLGTSTCHGCDPEKQKAKKKKRKKLVQARYGRWNCLGWGSIIKTGTTPGSSVSESCHFLFHPNIPNLVVLERQKVNKRAGTMMKTWFIACATCPAYENVRNQGRKHLWKCEKWIVFTALRWRCLLGIRMSGKVGVMLESRFSRVS